MFIEIGCSGGKKRRTMTTNKTTMEVHPAEKDLIELIRMERFGVIHELSFENGLPHHCKLALKNVKFGGKSK